MSESYTVPHADDSEYIEALARNIRITPYDSIAELLGKIVGELAILNGTLGKIERALTGGTDG